MLAPLSSLEAYRRDVAGTNGTGPDDITAAFWVEAASRLERAAMTKGADRERMLAGFLVQQGVVPFPSTPVDVQAVLGAVSTVTAAMEDASYFRLAFNMTASCLGLIAQDAVVARGRLSSQQARLARHLGEMEAARDLYQMVEQLGREHAEPELIGRGWNGLGVLAQLRGDFPEARRLFTEILDLEGAASDTINNAHHHLMVAAAAANDYDTATKHAWSAFQDATSPTQQTESLLNFAQLMLLAGHARSALRGFAAALARNPVPRLAFPTLGGAACAAAAAMPGPQAKALVRNFTSRVEDLVRGHGHGAVLPYPAASALVEISEALVLVGETESSERVSEKARQLASAHKFYELVHRLDNPPALPKKVTLAPETEAIIASVETLEGAEMVGA